MKPWITIGAFEVPAYFLVISVLGSLTAAWVRKRAARKKKNVKSALDIFLIILVGGTIGARILHVVYEQPEYYMESPSRIFEFWKGGFVFYGGALLAGFLAWRYSLSKRQKFAQWLDFFAPVLAFGYAFGRIGCLLAGCCYGEPCSLPWAITFPDGVEAPSHLPLHPTQLYAFFWELVVVFILLRLEKKAALPQGQLFTIWMGLHGLGRFIMELFRADERGPKVLGLSVSMTISLILVGLSAALLWKGHRKCIRSS